MPVLARNRVRYVGEEVAAVAAIDADTAEEAVALIQVDYEELAAVFDPVEAMKPDAPLIHPDYASYEGPRSKAPDL
jgi:CO/xanthine dehydrogenase Mo-binding subunit